MLPNVQNKVKRPALNADQQQRVRSYFNGSSDSEAVDFVLRPDQPFDPADVRFIAQDLGLFSSNDDQDFPLLVALCRAMILEAVAVNGNNMPEWLRRTTWSELSTELVTQVLARENAERTPKQAQQNAMGAQKHVTTGHLGAAAEGGQPAAGNAAASHSMKSTPSGAGLRDDSDIRAPAHLVSQAQKYTNLLRPGVSMAEVVERLKAVLARYAPEEQ